MEPLQCLAEDEEKVESWMYSRYAPEIDLLLLHLKQSISFGTDSSSNEVIFYHQINISRFFPQK